MRATPPPPPAVTATRPLPPVLLLFTGGAMLLLAAALLWRTRAGRQEQSRIAPIRPDDRVYLLLASGANWPLGVETTIGREGADLVLTGEGVAPLHARIVRAEEGYWLYDEGSSAGTYVNGQRLGLEGRLLQRGDELRFAGIVTHVQVS
jgi:pSer/pThr/pTyr-binding forkhead associated (FHA) protein